MPPIPTALAPVERFLSDEGLQLVADGFIQLAGPVPYPSAAEARRPAPAVRLLPRSRSSPSVAARSRRAPASWWRRGLVVTNVHVVAGTQSIRVEDSVGLHVAVVEYFDPEFDLAVLRVQGFFGRGPFRSTLTRWAGPQRPSCSAIRRAVPSRPTVPAAGYAAGLDIYGENPTVRSR